MKWSDVVNNAIQGLFILILILGGSWIFAACVNHQVPGVCP